MKSVHIIGSRLLGGAEGFYTRLLLGLQEAGDEVLAVVRGNGQLARELSGKISLARAPMFNRWDIYSRWRLRQIIARQRPGIVQTYMTRATVLTHLEGVRTPVHIARLGGYYKSDRYRHAHAWVGNTKGICDYLVRGGLPARRVFYIGNFVEEPPPVTAVRLTDLRRELVIPEQALVVLAAGRMVRKKGFDVLLDAFARLPAEVGGWPVHLLLAGDGPLRRELEQRAREKHIDTRVHWVGWQTDMTPYYALADLFVCPSRHEPLGNVILEGWSHALPVISSATLGANELIEHGEDGWIFPVEDSAQLADALRRLIKDTQLRTKLAETGLLKVRERFNKTAIVGAYRDLYQLLMDEAGG